MSICGYCNPINESHNVRKQKLSVEAWQEFTFRQITESQAWQFSVAIQSKYTNNLNTTNKNMASDRRPNTRKHANCCLNILNRIIFFVFGRCWLNSLYDIKTKRRRKLPILNSNGNNVWPTSEIEPTNSSNTRKMFIYVVGTRRNYDALI